MQSWPGTGCSARVEAGSNLPWPDTVDTGAAALAVPPCRPRLCRAKLALLGRCAQEQRCVGPEEAIELRVQGDSLPVADHQIVLRGARKGKGPLRLRDHVGQGCEEARTARDEGGVPGNRKQIQGRNASDKG